MDGHVSDATVAARRLQRWRSATNKARAAVRLSRTCQRGAAKPAGDSAADPPPVSEIAAKYCYPVPERQDGADEEGSDKRHAATRAGKCKWRCPLSCRPEELPQGAKLHGCVLDMGEAPDMKSCKGTWHGGGSIKDPEGVVRRRNEGRAAVEAVAAGKAEAGDVRVSVVAGRGEGPHIVSAEAGEVRGDAGEKGAEERGQEDGRAAEEDAGDAGGCQG